jgi:acyl-CoA thioesterase YciA
VILSGNVRKFSLVTNLRRELRGGEISPARCGQFSQTKWSLPPIRPRRNDVGTFGPLSNLGFPHLKTVELLLMLSLPTDRYLALKSAMMPRDTNHTGTIFGGVLLSHIDLAGAIGADHEIHLQGWPAQMLVTVALNRVEFHRPVFVGDVVSYWTRVTAVGRTSIIVHVSVEADRDGQASQLTEAEVVYVAVDAERIPRPIAPEA